MTAPCSRSSTSTATRSQTRRCWRAPRGTSWCRCSEGYGWHPLVGRPARSDPRGRARSMPLALDQSVRRDRGDPARAREEGCRDRPTWPMLILRSPKGWTCPAEVDGVAGRGDMAITPGTRRQRPGEPRAPGHPGDMDAELPPERAVRRGRGPEQRVRPAAPAGRATDERQPPRQRRPAAEAPRSARLPPLRRRGNRPRNDLERGDSLAG